MSRSTLNSWLIVALFVLGLYAISGDEGPLRIDRPAYGCGGGLFQQRQVGGVWISAEGLLSNPETDHFNQLRRAREQAMQPIPGDLNQNVGLRKISLRRLEAAIAEQQENKKPLSDEMRYLAGMQRIQYVFVYPEQQDIVLAGPGEGWKVNAQGEIVGATNGRPVMYLDDLMIALRTAEEARRTSISCSIDPTPEGLKRLQVFVKQQRTIGPDPAATIGSIEETLGPQIISVTGVPATSHFARVMVAADYRMKRLAMNFDESPIKGLPSFLHMMKAGRAGMQNMLPRWWLAPHYDPMLVDPDGLAWGLRGGSVKAMTEEDFIDVNGAKQHTGKANPVAQKWADNMTAHYEELSLKDPIFGQLRNCVDLAVVGALIVKERLPEKAGYSMSLLMDRNHLPNDEFNAPRNVDTKASVLKKGTNYLISASGGVDIQPWAFIEKSEKSDKVAPVRAAALPQGKHWWWN